MNTGDTTSRVFIIGKGLALKEIRSDTYFITQAIVFLQENATLADISSAGEAALVCMYTAAATKYLRAYLQMQVYGRAQGESRLGPQLHPHNLGFEAVDGRLLAVQRDMDVALKAVLKVMRCNCKMGCATLRCSCRKAGLDCSTGCGVSRHLS